MPHPGIPADAPEHAVMGEMGGAPQAEGRVRGGLPFRVWQSGAPLLFHFSGMQSFGSIFKTPPPGCVKMTNLSLVRQEEERKSDAQPTRPR